MVCVAWDDDGNCIQEEDDGSGDGDGDGDGGGDGLGPGSVPDPWWTYRGPGWDAPGWQQWFPDQLPDQWMHPQFGMWDPETGFTGFTAADPQMRVLWQILVSQTQGAAADRGERQTRDAAAIRNQERYQAYLDRQLAQNAALTREALKQGDEHFLAKLALEREALERQSEENRKNRALLARNSYAQLTGYFMALPGEPEPPAPRPGLAQSLAAFRS